ncbi:hypothetical protein [Spirosoma luteum]|uniref:hypothetical protein n=1 Tax=Spirosoma luteum TaxID=431553 RepID=UPI00037DE96D|nr:hypothetical protein [Spirosoma luteum]
MLIFSLTLPAGTRQLSQVAQKWRLFKTCLTAACPLSLDAENGEPALLLHPTPERADG